MSCRQKESHSTLSFAPAAQVEVVVWPGCVFAGNCMHMEKMDHITTRVAQVGLVV